MASIKDEKSPEHFFTRQCSSATLRFLKKPERTDNFPKSTPNFKACVGGVVFHLPRCFISKTKPTSLGYLELELFGHWTTYGRFRGMVKIATWVE